MLMLLYKVSSLSCSVVSYCVSVYSIVDYRIGGKFGKGKAWLMDGFSWKVIDQYSKIWMVLV